MGVQLQEIHLQRLVEILFLIIKYLLINTKEDEMPIGYHPLFLNIDPAPALNKAKKSRLSFAFVLAYAYLCN